MSERAVRHDLNQLWVLAALGQTRHVEQAAQLLGITQPGVSNALKRMRERFGDPLFVRTGRGMEPTPRGRQLVQSAQEILKQYEQRMLDSARFDPATTDTELRLAMSDIGEMVFLPRILEHLRVHAPRATVRAMNLRPSALAQALEEGSVDLAVGYFPDVKGANYFQQRLFSHGFACLVRADHPIVGKKLTRAAFMSLGHAVVQAEGRSQEVFEEYLRKQGIERRVVLNMPHFMSLPLVIAKSDLIVTVPLAVGTSFAQLAPLKLLAPPFELPRFDLKQHWHRLFHKDPRNVWMRSVIAALFNESQDEWRDIDL
jgi:DNA-binding transcriptional LysR family regulator